MPRLCSAAVLVLAVAAAAAQPPPPPGINFNMELPTLPIPGLFGGGLFGGGGGRGGGGGSQYSSHYSSSSRHSSGGQSFPDVQQGGQSASAFGSGIGGLPQFGVAGEGQPSSSRFEYSSSSDGGLPFGLSNGLSSGISSGLPSGFPQSSAPGGGQSSYSRYEYSSGGGQQLPALQGGDKQSFSSHDSTGGPQLPAPQFLGLPGFWGQSSSRRGQAAGGQASVPNLDGGSSYSYEYSSGGQQRTPGVGDRSSFSQFEHSAAPTGQAPQLPGFGDKTSSSTNEHSSTGAGGVAPFPALGGLGGFGSLGLDNLLKQLFPQLDLSKAASPLNILQSMFPSLNPSQLQHGLEAILKANPALDAQSTLNPMQFFSNILGQNKDVVNPFSFLDKLKSAFNVNSLTSLFPHLDPQKMLAPVIAAWQKAMAMPLEMLSKFQSQQNGLSPDLFQNIAKQLESFQSALPISPKHFLAMAEPFFKQFQTLLQPGGAAGAPFSPEHLMSLLGPLLNPGGGLGGLPSLGGQTGGAHRDNQVGGHGQGSTGYEWHGQQQQQGGHSTKKELAAQPGSGSQDQPSWPHGQSGQVSLDYGNGVQPQHPGSGSGGQYSSSQNDYTSGLPQLSPRIDGQSSNVDLSGGKQAQYPGLGGQSSSSSYELSGLVPNLGQQSGSSIHGGWQQGTNGNQGANTNQGSLGLESLLKQLFPKLDLSKAASPLNILKSMFPTLQPAQLQHGLAAILKAYPGLDANSNITPLQFFSKVLGQSRNLSPLSFMNKLESAFNVNSLTSLFPQLGGQAGQVEHGSGLLGQQGLGGAQGGSSIGFEQHGQNQGLGGLGGQAGQGKGALGGLGGFSGLLGQQGLGGAQGESSLDFEHHGQSQGLGGLGGQAGLGKGGLTQEQGKGALGVLGGLGGLGGFSGLLGQQGEGGAHGESSLGYQQHGSKGLDGLGGHAGQGKGALGGFSELLGQQGPGGARGGSSFGFEQHGNGQGFGGLEGGQAHGEQGGLGGSGGLQGQKGGFSLGFGQEQGARGQGGVQLGGGGSQESPPSPLGGGSSFNIGLP